MRLGIFAKTFPGDTPEGVMAAAAAAGYDGVQYNMACSGLEPMPDDLPPAVAQAVSEASRRTGQQVFALSGTYNMAHPDLMYRQRGVRRFRLLAQSCAMMGVDLVTLCTGTRDPDDQWRHHPDNQSEEAWRDMCRSFEALIAIAEECRIRLGVEPELANVVNSARAARRLISEMASDRITIVLDPANLFEVATAEVRRDLISGAVDLLGDHLAMAHAKDRLPDGDFATAGQGVIDFGHYFRKLAQAGFAGPVVTHGLSSTEAAGVSTFLRRCIAEARS